MTAYDKKDSRTYRSRKRIRSLQLSETLAHRSGGLLAQEKKQALHDLVRNSFFNPVNDDNGPYDIYLTTENNTLVMVIHDDSDKDLGQIKIPVSPYKRLIKDYFMLIESHRKARASHMMPEKLEALDMGRRSLHEEGANMLQEELKSRIAIDHDTARRFFTLMCALSLKNHNRLF